MSKVSMKSYLKRLGKAFLKILIKSLIIGIIFSVVSLIASFFLESSYIKILRIVGFAFMLVGAISKLGGHSLNTNHSYKFLMTSSSVRSMNKHDRDSIMGNNGFLITCMLIGFLIFAYSIILSDYILK